MPRQGFAIGKFTGAHRFMIYHLNKAMPLIGQSLQQVARQITVPPPAIETRILPIWGMEGERDRLDRQITRQIWRQKGLKQRRFKRQHPPPVCRGALWKKQQPMTVAQAPLQKLQMKLRLLAITGDELCASGPGEPANHGPICNL